MLDAMGVAMVITTTTIIIGSFCYIPMIPFCSSAAQVERVGHSSVRSGDVFPLFSFH